jgi:large subunit ribosomal protein L29
MKPDEIRDLTDEELDVQIEQAEEEIFRLEFRKAYQELENPALVRTRKRDLARLKTIRHERKRERENGDVR